MSKNKQGMSSRAAERGQRKSMPEEKVNMMSKGGMVVSDAALSPQDLVQYKQYERAHTPLVYKDAKIGRNELCPCGSGKKFKKCHLPMEDRA